MKDSAKWLVVKADPRIKTLNEEEISEKVDLFYSLGYVYSPYKLEFRNPFIDKGFKAISVYNLDLAGIQQMHDHLYETSIKENGKVATLEEVQTLISNIGGSNSQFLLTLKALSGIIGIACLVVAIILQLVGQLYIAVGLELVSITLINHYVCKNAVLTLMEGDWKASQVWNKYQGLFYVLSVASYIYFYYLLYLATNSFWIPILIILPLRYFTRKSAVRQLGIEYLQFNSYHEILDYAESNNIN